MFHHFVEMTGHLSETMKDINIIIRPHPSENLTTWKDATKIMPNVNVFHEGNVIPWILASKLMIHNSCTTGVEAYVLGKPGISYCPITSETFDSDLPNALSVQVFSLNELIKAARTEIDNDMEKETDPQQANHKQALIDHYISNLRGSTASEVIVRVLRELVTEKPVSHIKKSFPIIDGTMNILEASAISGVRLLRRFLKGPEAGGAYMKQKFTGLDIAEIEQALGLMNQATSRFNQIHIQPVPRTRSCFLISKDQD
ncbi:MAG: hypothetical protein JRJ85_15570 [Deltaproteobacteria bacterium]|nr:hypothetical protein [Deltaproteobacteria bacterium]